MGTVRDIRTARTHRPAPLDPKLDLTGRIMAFEQGDMPGEDVIPFFQDLIDTGLAWQLQGTYGRAAKALIEGGECHA